MSPFFLKDFPHSRKDTPFVFASQNQFYTQLFTSPALTTAVFVLDKLADCGYNINVASEQFHVSIGDTAGFSLPRVRPYLGRKFFLEEADGVRINYLYRDGPPPCGW